MNTLQPDPELDAWAQREAAKAPPLSPAQIDLVSRLIAGTQSRQEPPQRRSAATTTSQPPG